jgi:hypothetical protein
MSSSFEPVVAVANAAAYFPTFAKAWTRSILTDPSSSPSLPYSAA